MNQIDTNDLKYVQERGYKPLGWIPGAVDQETGKINPQVTKLYLGGTQFISVFHVKPIYYETTAGTWRPMGEICSHHGNKRIELNTDWRKAAPRFINWLTKRQALFGQDLLLPTPFGFIPSQYQDQIRPTISIGLTTTTVYPDPDTETTTVDGSVGHRGGAGGAWSASQATATGGAANDSSTSIGAYFGVGAGRNSGSKIIVERNIVLFDTSSISPDTLDSATLTMTPNSTGEIQNDKSTGTDYVYVCESSPASNTAVVVGDYDAVGDSVGAPSERSDTITYAALVTAGLSVSVYTINGADLTTVIDSSGISKLGLRSGDDITADPSFSTNELNRTIYRSADYAGTTSDPKLVVVHSVAVTAVIKSVNGLAKASIKSWNGVILE